MKKSLIALAALATVATAAQAQSSVTIYGVLDAGITRATNTGANALSQTGMTNGGLSTPRFGFKGAEDLGGGLKAGFLLEGELLTDTGAQLKPGSTSDGTLFSRSSFLSLEQAGVGSMQLGFMNHQDYNMSAKYDAFGGNNIGGWVASNSGTVDLSVNQRISNAVEVQTASIGGLVVTGQYGFGEVAGAITSGRTVAIGAEYTLGKASVAANYVEKNATTAGYATTKVKSAYAAYDFGVAKTTAGYAQTETDGSAVKPSGYFVGAVVPVTGKVNVLAQYNAFDNDAGAKPKTYALGATYGFSKRTTGYVIGARSSQDGNSAQNVVSTSKYNGFDTPPAGANQTVASVGIRHTF